MIKVKKISQLPEADKPTATDFINISQDQGDGTYSSKKITFVSFTSSNVNVIDPNVFIPLERTYTNTEYYISVQDDYIRVNSTTKGKYDLILPLAAGSGKTYTIKNISKRNSEYNTDITIKTIGNDTIDLDYSYYKIRFQECIQFIDGEIGKWEIISRG